MQKLKPSSCQTASGWPTFEIKRLQSSNSQLNFWKTPVITSRRMSSLKLGLLYRWHEVWNVECVDNLSTPLCVLKRVVVCRASACCLRHFFVYYVINLCAQVSEDTTFKSLIFLDWFNDKTNEVSILMHCFTINYQRIFVHTISLWNSGTLMYNLHVNFRLCFIAHHRTFPKHRWLTYNCVTSWRLDLFCVVSLLVSQKMKSSWITESSLPYIRWRWSSETLRGWPLLQSLTGHHHLTE